MFSSFVLGMQQDVKIFLLPPLLCAVFRLIFIMVYRPKKSPRIRPMGTIPLVSRQLLRPWGLLCCWRCARLPILKLTR